MATATNGYRYDAFISYRHCEPDRKMAKWLHAALESYRVPKKLVRERKLPPRLQRVFRDEEELAASADLSRSIDEALTESRFLVVVCSPRTPGSKWVDAEVRRFRELNRGDSILALLVEGEPRDSFPQSLCEIRRTAVDAAGEQTESLEEIEPLAADLRPQSTESRGHVFRMARLRILATLLDCRFDELRRREQERQTRWLLAAGGFLAILLLVMTSLTVFALAAKRELQVANAATIRQRDVALNAKAEASKQRDQALENLKLARQATDYFLTEASQNPRLREQDLEEMRKELLQEAAKIYEAFARQKWNEPELELERGKVFGRIGDILAQIGSPSESLDHYQQALEVLGALASEHPQAAYQVAVAVTLKNLGIVQRNTHQFEGAESSYDQARRICEQVIESDPEYADAVRVFAESFGNLANLYKQTGRLSKAEEAYREIQKRFEQLADIHAGVLAYREGLATTYSNLGILLQMTDRTGEAEEAFARRHRKAMRPSAIA